MKKTLLWASFLLTILVLSWCGSKDTPKDPIEALDNPTVTTWDVQDFNTIVGWSWYSEAAGKTSLFTFKWDNTFAVTANEKEARGPWIVSEWKILLGESQLELVIQGDNEITIDGIIYLRNEEIN